MLTRNGRRLSAALLTTVGVVAAGGGWAVAEGGGNAPTHAAAGGTTAVGEVQPAIKRNFALFRERAASPMPGDVVAQVGSEERFGRDASLARAIRTATGTGWVIPGDGYLCIVVPDPVDGYATGCMPTEAAIGQGLLLSMGGNLANGGVVDTLLVPDGARAVRGDETVPTDRGVASVYVPRPGTLRAAK